MYQYQASQARDSPKTSTYDPEMQQLHITELPKNIRHHNNKKTCTIQVIQHALSSSKLDNELCTTYYTTMFYSEIIRSTTSTECVWTQSLIPFSRVAFCNTLQLPFVIKIFALSIFEWPFYMHTGFIVLGATLFLHMYYIVLIIHVLVFLNNFLLVRQHRMQILIR